MERTETIDVNENRNRYYFTREATQRDFRTTYGVVLSAIGKYYPDRSLATVRDPPLAIRISGPEEAVQRALEHVTQVLVHGPPVRQAGPVVADLTRTVPLGFVPDPARLAAVRTRLMGPPPAASHLRHIAGVSGVRQVLLGGQGSGQARPDMSTAQLAEPLHLLLVGRTEGQLQTAEILARDLVMVVKWEYDNRLL